MDEFQLNQNQTPETNTTNVPTPTIPDAANPQTINTAPDQKPKSRKKLIVVLTIVVLLIAGGLIYWFVLKKSGSSTSSSQSVPNLTEHQDIFSSPRFTNVTDYEKFDEAEWYTVNGGVIRVNESGQSAVYTNNKGVPIGFPSGLAVYKNRLWVSTGDGVAVLKDDGSGFESSSFKLNDKILNGQLLYDSAADKLYLSAFENFYQFNDAKKSWDPVKDAGASAPKNIKNSALNKDYLVVSGYGPDNLLWILNRKIGSWTKSMPALEDQSQDVFTLNGEIFVSGRTSGYDSCAAEGKLSATSFYKLDANGKWQPLKDINSDKSRPELMYEHSVKNTVVSFESSPCKSNEKAARYTATYNGSTIVLKKEGEISAEESSTLQDGREQTALVSELKNKTKLHPFVRVRDIDSSGNVIFTASDKPDGGSSSAYDQDLYVAKGAKLQAASKIEISKLPDPNYSTVRPIVCNKDGKRSLAYVFAGVEAEGEGGPTGQWQSAKIYKVEGLKATEWADLGKDVTQPNFACADDKLTWLGTSKVQQINLDSKKISAIGSAVGNQMISSEGRSFGLPNGDLWVLNYQGNKDLNLTSQLYYVNAKNQTVKKVTSIKGANLLAGSSSHVWLSSPPEDQTPTIYTYDTNGKQLSAKKYNVPGIVIPVSDDSAAIFASKSKDIYTQFNLFKVTASGTSSTVDLKDSAITGYYGGGDAGVATVVNQFGVYDKQRGLLWVSDGDFGLYTVRM